MACNTLRQITLIQQMYANITLSHTKKTLQRSALAYNHPVCLLKVKAKIITLLLNKMFVPTDFAFTPCFKLV